MDPEIQTELNGILDQLKGDMTVTDAWAALDTLDNLEKLVTTHKQLGEIDVVRMKIEAAREVAEAKANVGRKNGALPHVPTLKRKLPVSPRKPLWGRSHGSTQPHTIAQFTLSARNPQAMAPTQEVTSRNMQLEYLLAKPNNHTVLTNEVKALQIEVERKTAEVNNVTMLFAAAAEERDRVKELVRRHEQQNKDYFQTIQELTRKLSEVHQPTTQQKVPRQNSEPKIQKLEAALKLKGQQIRQLQKDHQEILRQHTAEVAHSNKMVQANLELESQLGTLQETLSQKNQQIYHIQQNHQMSIHQMSGQLNYTPNLQAQLDTLQKTVTQKDQEIYELRNSKQELATVLKKYFAEEVPRNASQLKTHEPEIVSAQIKQEPQDPDEVLVSAQEQTPIRLLEHRSDTSGRDHSFVKIEALSTWTMDKNAC